MGCVSPTCPCSRSVVPFKPVPGLPPPSRRVSPISLIGGKDRVLPVAGWWVAAVYPVHHCSSDPPGPRFQGRDATVQTQEWHFAIRSQCALQTYASHLIHVRLVSLSLGAQSSHLFRFCPWFGGRAARAVAGACRLLTRMPEAGVRGRCWRR